MHPLIQPYTTYQTQDKKHIVVGAATDQQFAKFCQVLQLGELAQKAEFATNADRVRNKHALQQLLSARVANFSQAHLIAQFTENGVPFSEIESMASLFDKQETKAMNLTAQTGN